MRTSLLTACAAVVVLISPAIGQQALPTMTTATQGIKRIPLQRFEVPGTSFETVIGIAEIAPGTSVGRHIHPGPESGYLIEGSFELLIEGQPPRQLKAGDSYVVPGRVIHDAKTGPAGAKVIATYVVEKGQPLASPAP